MRILHTIIATLIFVGLSYLALTLIDDLFLKDIQNLNYPEFNYKLIYSLIFGLFVGSSIIQNSDVKLIGLILLVILVVVGFIIDGLMILNASKYQISPQIINTLTLKFKMIYYLPVYPFILILFIRIIRVSNANRFINRIPDFAKNMKINTARLFAFLFDCLIVIIVGLILYKFQIILWFPVEILLVNFAYRFIFETTFSRTIGKIIFGIMIIRVDNNEPTLNDILIRNLCRLTIFYWIPILNNKIGLHDRLSKTRIIKNALQHAI
jgi:uncharacterized RDD family membrane protein YckC